MIAIENLSLSCGGFRLSRLTLGVPEGGYGVLMGATGSGKTTLLEAVCGLRAIETGTVHIGGVNVTGVPIAGRRIGYVPQDAAVFKRMTVRENLAFPLTIRKRPRRVVRERTDQLGERLSLSGLLDRRADGLSGGEAQRVAIGRALAAEPVALLLDEPLASLDDPARDGLIRLLKEVHAETGLTALHVTHNRGEAAELADTVFTLAGGRITGAGPPTPDAAKNAGSRAP